MRKFFAWLFAPRNDNAVALQEVASARSRMRKFEAFLLGEVERVKLRVKLLEVERGRREAAEKAAQVRSVYELPTKPYIASITSLHDPDATPVYRKKTEKP